MHRAQSLLGCWALPAAPAAEGEGRRLAPPPVVLDAPRVLHLDPEHHPVKIAADRTQRLIADRDYRDAISKAIIAIDERRFEKAAAALSAALKIKSGGDELRELQNRLEHERQAAIVEDFSRRALQSQEKEDNLDKNKEKK